MQIMQLPITHAKKLSLESSEHRSVSRESIVPTYSTDNAHNPSPCIIIQRICLHTDGVVLPT